MDFDLKEEFQDILDDIASPENKAKATDVLTRMSEKTTLYVSTGNQVYADDLKQLVSIAASLLGLEAIKVEDRIKAGAQKAIKFAIAAALA